MLYFQATSIRIRIFLKTEVFLFRFRKTPHPHVAFSNCFCLSTRIRIFLKTVAFSPFSKKKFVPTRSFFKSFLSVQTVPKIHGCKILGPVHTYPDVYENGGFFSSFSKKSASARSVFKSFLPVYEI